MSEVTEDLTNHRDNLKLLCRICGEKLKKAKEKYESSYSCTEYVDFLANKYQLNVEKDDNSIHPPRFCNKCYLSSSNSRSPVFWEIHTEENCKTCYHVTERLSKGGRPRKTKRGKKSASEKSETSTADQTTHRSVMEGLKMKTLDIRQSLESPRPTDFENMFHFVEIVKADLSCPICKDILDMPLETSCEHYFCTHCFSNALDVTQVPACPVCKTDLDNCKVKPATRVILRLIGELKVECNKCKSQVNYEDSRHHICPPTPCVQPGIAQPAARLVAPAAVPAPPVQPAGQTLQDALEELRQGKVSPEVEKLGTMFIKSKLKASTDGKSALLRTQGKVIKQFIFLDLLN